MDAPPTHPSPPTDIPFFPPPWDFKAELYLFTTLLKPVQREDPTLQGLPPGSYNPSETVHPSGLAPVNGAPQWKGGLSYIVIVRYLDSPIGPYDELIAVTDGFANPFEKRATAGRITNIYVNSRKSVWHGRTNWNIQKHLARFEFIPTDSTTTVKVFLPDAEVPFFSASITDSSIPAIPLPAFLLNPFMRIVQPPLLASNPPDIEVASTKDEWVSVTPEYSGRWCPAYIQPSEGGSELYGDGVHYPRTKVFWIGAKFSGSIHLAGGDKFSGKDE